MKNKRTTFADYDCASSRGIVIVSSNLDKEMEEEMSTITVRAFKYCAKIKDIINEICAKMKRAYGSNWHCFVNCEDYDLLSESGKSFIKFNFDDTNFVLFRTK